MEWAIVAVVALALALGMRTFVFQAYFVPSGSMIPTLQVGDRILVQKLFFSPSDVHTGEIVVFHGPAADVVCGSPQSILVKRVIGLPGETIQSKGNTVYLDGKALAEPWLPAGTQLGRAIPKQTIPPGRYFMMGDNRSISCDSRYWGTIPGSSIVGKVLILWWRFGRPAFHIF
jgi:signal peptidase I